MSKLTKEDNELLMKLIKRFPCYNTKYIDKYGVPICMKDNVKVFNDLFNPDLYTYGQVNYNNKLDKHYIELAKPIKYFDNNSSSIINITELYFEKLVQSKINIYQYCYIEKEKIEDISKSVDILDIDKYIKLINEENFEELYKIIKKLEDENNLLLNLEEKALFTKLMKLDYEKSIKLDENTRINIMTTSSIKHCQTFINNHVKNIFENIERNINIHFADYKKIYNGQILENYVTVNWKYEIKENGLNILNIEMFSII